MNRRSFLATASVLCLPLSVRGFANPGGMKTRWIVRGSEGFDALAFLSPLSGDPFYASYYPAAVAEFGLRLPPPIIAAIKSLKERTTRANVLLSPFLSLAFSGGPDSTIGDLVRSLDSAETVLRPPLQASPYWGEESWMQFVQAAPAIRSILLAMRDAGFAEFQKAIFEPKAHTRLPALRAKLAGFDVVEGVERFTGKQLKPEIAIIMLEFCKPHGVKVIGQKFLSAIDWGDHVHIRTAGHELLHPPVDMDGPAATAALAILRKDRLLARIIAEHDPAFGYNSLEGLFDEDLASALDQIIAERFNVARDPKQRWTDVDGGMHVLAAALYGLMKQDGYATCGGDLEQWLLNKARGGWLCPPTLHAAAARVLDRPADQLWPPPASKKS